ncbi:MAG: PTS sugar transporter subunit IIA [Verrucomicrobiae bacterium]|nr:PTS sugar transporter subunit IIA [Verrucomicrobiae bacterium]
MARAFDVSEKTIHRWVKERQLPAFRDGSWLRFSREEVLEWAAMQRLPLSPQFLAAAENDASPLPTLAEALTAGGVHYGVEGADKQSVLRAVVNRLRLPPSINRDWLWALLWARESLESTAVGEGVAIPHPRHPIVLDLARPLVSLCFLRQPVDFGALDGQPVFALFLLISPTVKVHLHLLARLAYGLRDARLKALLSARAGEQDLLAAVAATEAGLAAARNTPPAKKL